MNTDKLIELAFYTLPGIVTGVVALYAFKTFSKNDEHRRRMALMRENQKQAFVALQFGAMLRYPMRSNRRQLRLETNLIFHLKRHEA